MPLSDTMKALAKAAGMTDAEIATLDAAPASGDTSTPTKPKITSTSYPSISSSTQASTIINKVCQDVLKRPATAAEMKSLEILGSWAMTALGRSPRLRASSVITKAAACAKLSANSAVMSLFAIPRTPSVPKSLPMAEA
jgi:hypothetical protein